MPPLVSAIVPARELNELGRRCVAELLALGDVEVVLVTDEPPEDVDPRVVCVASGPANTGVKRQLGLERSRGEYIALIDDDAYPHPDWLANALGAFESDPDIGAVCGPTLTPAGEPELEVLSGRVYASPLVTGPERWRYAPLPARDVDDAPSVNLVLRRADAEAIGLATPYDYGEDTVVCERLIARGRRIRYLPQAVVFHSRRPLWRPHLRQVWRWARRRGAFARAGGVNSRRPGYLAPSTLLIAAASRPLLPDRLVGLWRAGMGAYGLACLAAGRDRQPRRWLRLSGAIVATHAAYGLGFLLGLAGLPLPERRRG
jgi:glycosyltransferase involved in cell wall biosynthesis